MVWQVEDSAVSLLNKNFIFLLCEVIGLRYSVVVRGKRSINRMKRLVSGSLFSVSCYSGLYLNNGAGLGLS